MPKKTFLPFLLLCLLVAVSPTLAAGTIQQKIDLADIAADSEITRQIEPRQAYSFHIVNKVPTEACGASVIVEEIEIAALDLPSAFIAPTPASTQLVAAATVPCKDRIKAAFKDVSTPIEVRGAISALKLEPGNCSEAELTTWINDETTSTETNGDKGWSAKKGQRLVVTVSCGDDTRTAHFTTGAKGEWVTSYGFTFVPNQDELFFAKAGEENGTFLVTAEDDNEDLDFAPSILFQFQKPGKKHGLLAGLGHDLENVMVFGGYGWTLHRNVTFAFGAAIHEQKRLDGRFSVGDTLKEQLDTDQLLDETYAANVFFGISFRFNRDPFVERNKLIEQRNEARKKTADARKKEAEAQKKADAAEQEAKEIKENLLKTCTKTAEIAKTKAESQCKDGAEGDSCRELVKLNYELAELKCMNPAEGEGDGDGNGDGDGDGEEEEEDEEDEEG